MEPSQGNYDCSDLWSHHRPARTSKSHSVIPSSCQDTKLRRSLFRMLCNPPVPTAGPIYSSLISQPLK